MPLYRPHHSIIQCLAALVGIVALTLCCLTGQIAEATQVKGLWVRPTAYTQEDINVQAQQFKQAGITDIFLESYYLGQTVFPSQTMEHYKLPTQHRQFRGNDVVAFWVEAAHNNGLKLHAWLQVFYAGNKEEFLDDEPYGPILSTYPAWSNRLYGTPGETASSGLKPVASVVESGHYFLDPANPDVQTYLQTLITEVITRYPTLDGLQLDYIRYPSALPVTNPSYLGSTWGYTPAAWKGFLADPAVKAKIATLPAWQQPKQWKALTTTHPLWPLWVNYRKAQVSKLVAYTAQQAKALANNRPQPLQLTAVMFATTEPTKAQKCQNYPEWIANQWLDAIVPIGLSAYAPILGSQLKALKAELVRPTVWVGNFDLYNRRPTTSFKENLMAVDAAQLNGVVLFESSRLSAEYSQALAEYANPNAHPDSPAGTLQ